MLAAKLTFEPPKPILIFRVVLDAEHPGREVGLNWDNVGGLQVSQEYLLTTIHTGQGDFEAVVSTDFDHDRSAYGIFKPHGNQKLLYDKLKHMTTGGWKIILFSESIQRSCHGSKDKPYDEVITGWFSVFIESPPALPCVILRWGRKAISKHIAREIVEFENLAEEREREKDDDYILPRYEHFRQARRERRRAAHYHVMPKTLLEVVEEFCQDNLPMRVTRSGMGRVH